MGKQEKWLDLSFGLHQFFKFSAYSYLHIGLGRLTIFAPFQLNFLILLFLIPENIKFGRIFSVMMRAIIGAKSKKNTPVFSIGQELGDMYEC